MRNIFRRWELWVLAFIMRTGKIWPQRDLPMARGWTKAGYMFSFTCALLSIGSAIWHLSQGSRMVFHGWPACISVLTVTAIMLGRKWGNSEKRRNWILKVARTCDSGMVQGLLGAAKEEEENFVATTVEAMPKGVFMNVNKKVLAGVLASKNRDVRIAALRRIN